MTDSYSTTRRPPEVTGWTGWVSFAGMMLVLLGLFHAVEGLVAVFNEGYYRVTQSGLLVNVSYDVWGWVHFGVGVLAVIIGVGVLTGNIVAQIVGAILAGVSAIIHLAFVPAYPIWSLIIIAVDVIVIYALVAHGQEMKRTD